MGIIKCIEYHGDRVRKYCSGNELNIALHFHIHPNSTIITISDVQINPVTYGELPATGWYETLRGEHARYDDPELFHWLKKCYKALKELDISHNDIMLQNIVVLPNKDYRLIDFETVRSGGGSFHDWCKINQLMKRIQMNCPDLNNTSCNRDGDQNSVSFFRQ